MKNIFTTLAATTAIGLSISAYAVDDFSTKDSSSMECKKNGGYEATTSSQSTTSDGTDRSTENKVNFDVDSNGNIDKTVSKESVTDPKGLWNKKKDLSETEIKEKSNGGYTQTTIRKHTDRSGTNTYYKTVTDVDVDSKNNVTSTSTSEKITKPKGWFNSSKSTSKIKTVNGNVVEHTEEPK